MWKRRTHWSGRVWFGLRSKFNVYDETEKNVANRKLFKIVTDRQRKKETNKVKENEECTEKSAENNNKTVT